jgi:hypothetical protein
MSWHTPLGERILEGTEAAFYLSAMQHAVEYLQEMEDVASDLDVVTGGSFASPKVSGSSIPQHSSKKLFCYGTA